MEDERERPERFPPLLLLALPLGAWVAFAGWRTTAGDGFFESLIWPGLAILAGALAVAVLGWKLDID
jgi:hypothetical protein